MQGIHRRLVEGRRDRHLQLGAKTKNSEFGARNVAVKMGAKFRILDFEPNSIDNLTEMLDNSAETYQ